MITNTSAVTRPIRKNRPQLQPRPSARLPPLPGGFIDAEARVGLVFGCLLTAGLLQGFLVSRGLPRAYGARGGNRPTPRGSGDRYHEMLVKTSVRGGRAPFVMSGCIATIDENDRTSG